MVMVCYDKPNRKNVRHFTDRDVARIATYAIRDGANVRKILARILVVVGFGFVACRAAKALSALLSVSSFLTKVGGILAVSALVQKAIAILSKGALLKVPVVNRYAIGLIAVLAAIDGILSALREVIADRDALVTVSDFISDLCKEVSSLGG